MDEDEREDDGGHVEAYDVVGEQGRKQGPVPVDGVERQVVLLLLLVPGWMDLWRPGNSAGSQPRIAERGARDVDRVLFEEVEGELMAPVWREVWGEESG